MAFIPGDGKVQVTLQFSQADGELAQNVFGVDTNAAGPVDATVLANLGALFVDWFNVGSGGSDSYKGVLSTRASLLTVISRDLTSEVGTEVFTEPATSGSDGGDPLPNGQTFTLTARTGTTGRSHRGRTYLVGLTKNFLDGSDPNVADAAHAAEALAFFNTLIAGVAGIGACTLAVFSRFHAGAPRASIVSTDITTYGYHDLFMDYQRRRAPGHNRHH